MSLIRWEPFREMDDLFSRFAPSVFNRRWPEGAAEARYHWSPTADISETETEYLIRAELPGVPKEGVRVTVENGVITIAGERRQEKEDKNEKFHRVERFHGSFSRSFSLPETADAAAIRAESKDGTLLVRIPKIKAEKPRAVQVQVN